VTSLPAGFTLVLDRSVRSYRRGAVLVGGSPLRALRMTSAGTSAIAGLQHTAETSEAARSLGRRLVDAGLAHPRPPAASASELDITVVVPARDRLAALEGCLSRVGDAAPVIVVDDGSVDASAVAAICERHRVGLVRRDAAGGPAAARNAAMPLIETALVAFLDSDCVPDPDWLPRLVGHFADPLVGAVAPRVSSDRSRGGTRAVDRFTQARSPIDMGPHEGLVRPGAAIGYVPTAALLVRRSAIGAQPFDPGLRYGEDVDLVWRLHDGGWHIRYVPSVRVHHAEPDRWRTLLRRRFQYGTSAAALARRHPGRLSPLVLRAGPTTAAAAVLARRPGVAVVVVVLQGALLARRTRSLGVPDGRSLLWSASALRATLLQAGSASTMLAAPALALALRRRRTRVPALALLLGPPLEQWLRQRPRLDPIRWTVASVAHDVAYGAGVWRGCLGSRTAEPLLPRLARARAIC
jgi:mycofactocin system glycosyltransferase